jgi:hypothetical protein
MTEERLEDTELYKKIQRRREQDRIEEKQKRTIIEEGDSSDPLRNFDSVTKDWVKRFLNLSGVIRNEYSQITDIYKRPSERQIRGMLKELLNIEISERKIRQYKRYLVEKGELMSDEEFRLQQPTREVLREIKKTGARAMAIQRSKEKSHLSPQELEQILERQKKEEKPEDNRTRMKELRRKIEENGYCPTDFEERELEEYEENNEGEG